jgi:hypothetical protein
VPFGLQNGDFESGISYWSVSNGGVIFSGGAESGNNYFQMDGVVASGLIISTTNSLFQQVTLPANPATVYGVSLYVKSPASTQVCGYRLCLLQGPTYDNYNRDCAFNLAVNIGSQWNKFSYAGSVTNQIGGVFMVELQTTCTGGLDVDNVVITGT